MVRNLQVRNTKLRENVILTWNIHEGAYIYDVTVRKLYENKNINIYNAIFYDSRLKYYLSIDRNLGRPNIVLVMLSGLIFSAKNRV